MSTPSKETTIRVQGVVRRTSLRRRSAPIALFYAALFESVSVLPTFEDSDEGLARARVIKVCVLIVGLLILLASYDARVTIIPGVLVMLLALIVPISTSKKSSLRRRFKRAQCISELRDVPATLTHDGRRLILEVDGERLRRVLTNRSFVLERHGAQAKHPTHPDVEAWVGVLPGSSRRKKESIWIGLRGDDIHLSPARNFDPSAADNPIVIDVKEGEAGALLDRLKDAHSRHA